MKCKSADVVLALRPRPVLQNNRPSEDLRKAVTAATQQRLEETAAAA